MNPFSCFDQLTDPRSPKSLVYPLDTIVFLTVAAVTAGADSFVEIEVFGKNKLNWLKKYVCCPDDRIPSHDTLGDLFSRLNPKEFQQCFINWTSQVCNITEGDLIAIDGKRLRGSYDRHDNKAAIHMVSAWSSKNQIVLGQTKVDQKSNEITAIPVLIDLLDLKGAIVSIDAMGCQKEVAKQIRKAEADYILALKGNQSTLEQQVKAHFGYAVPASQNETVTKGHGRIETRKCTVIDNLDMLDQSDQWPELNTVIRIESLREFPLTKKNHTETRYYISSRQDTAKAFNTLIRQHWEVENKLHWVLDVNFREDHSRIRLGHADENFSTIRRIALNIIKLDNTVKASQRAKRKMASWNDRFLEAVLKL